MVPSELTIANISLRNCKKMPSFGKVFLLTFLQNTPANPIISQMQLLLRHHFCTCFALSTGTRLYERPAILLANDMSKCLSDVSDITARGTCSLDEEKKINMVVDCIEIVAI